MFKYTVGHSLKSSKVVDTLADLFLCKRVQEQIRSEKGSEFTSKDAREWLYDPQTLYIEPGSLWENGDNESFNGLLKDEVAQWRKIL